MSCWLEKDNYPSTSLHRHVTLHHFLRHGNPPLFMSTCAHHVSQCHTAALKKTTKGSSECYLYERTRNQRRLGRDAFTEYCVEQVYLSHIPSSARAFPGQQFPLLPTDSDHSDVSDSKKKNLVKIYLVQTSQEVIIHHPIDFNKRTLYCIKQNLTLSVHTKMRNCKYKHCAMN